MRPSSSESASRISPAQIPHVGFVATLRGRAKRPRDYDRSVPRDLDALCDRCLQVSAKRRLPSAEALEVTPSIITAAERL